MQIYEIDKDVLLKNILTLQHKKVLILGDVMLDVYLQGDAQRISPEAPVPIVRINSQKYLPGGAANVARNISVLGGLPTLIGLCGLEYDGNKLIYLLEKDSINSCLLQSEKRNTTVKTRIMAQNQQMLRFDKEDYLANSDDENEKICKLLTELIPQHDILVISDYAKGMINNIITKHIQKLTKNAKQTQVLIDPKPKNASIYGQHSLMTPNKNEASALSNMVIDSKQDAIAAGRIIMEEYHCHELLMTLGSAGMALFTHEGSVWNIAPQAKAVFDVTGAGDTVIAMLAIARAANLSLIDACILATHAASLVLEHVGVACVTAEEVSETVEKSILPPCIRWA